MNMKIYEYIYIYIYTYTHSYLVEDLEIDVINNLYINKIIYDINVSRYGTEAIRFRTFPGQYWAMVGLLLINKAYVGSNSIDTLKIWESLAKMSISKQPISYNDLTRTVVPDSTMPLMGLRH